MKLQVSTVFGLVADFLEAGDRQSAADAAEELADHLESGGHMQTPDPRDVQMVMRKLAQWLRK